MQETPIIREIRTCYQRDINLVSDIMESICDI